MQIIFRMIIREADGLYQNLSSSAEREHSRYVLRFAVISLVLLQVPSFFGLRKSSVLSFGVASVNG